MIRSGNWEIDSIVTGWDRLDGGAMFGVVPKVLWNRSEDVDSQNRILMTMRTLLAVHRSEKRVVLVDTGAGPKWSEKAAARFAISHSDDAIPSALANIGLSTQDVTDVVVTHAHFDHCGGMSRWKTVPGEETELIYPGARHWVHEKHWEHANSPTDRDRASFLPCDLEALASSDKLFFVSGDDPECDLPGVNWRLSHGHTPYQLLPLFADDESPLLFAGDLIPTASHLRPSWVMAYDLFPLTSMEERKAVYHDAAASHYRIAFPHDRHCGGAVLSFADGRVSVADRLMETPESARSFCPPAI